MEQKKVDRRIIKTRKAIRNALISLLKNHDIDDITITDIAREADIDRKTIYNYYAGVYEVISEFEQSLCNSIIEEIDNQYALYPKNTIKPIVLAINAIVINYYDIALNLINKRGISSIVLKIVSILKDKMKEYISHHVVFRPLDIDITTEFIMSGLFNSYRLWLIDKKDKITIEELADELDREFTKKY